MAIARIHPDILLDNRLALFHETEGWMAVADLHYGYEQEFRHAGGLFPLWGNQRIEERLEALIADHSPRQLIILGDLVHGRGSHKVARPFCDWLAGLGPEIVFIQGNHDSGLSRLDLMLQESLSLSGFFFHHGHLALEPGEGEIEITGHHHPAIKLNDGAGLRLKLPAMIQEQYEGRERWILPAFSPWASGTAWKSRPQSSTRWWACAPERVVELAESGLPG